MRCARGGTRGVLFKGAAGSGKTTELLHLAEALGERRFVVFFDFEQHFRTTLRNAGSLQTAQPWELVFLVGAAVLRAGDELGIPWAPAHKRDLEAAYGKLIRPGAANVDLAVLASSLSVLVGGVPVCAGVPGLVRLTSAREVPDTIRGFGPLPDHDTRVTRLVDAVDAILHHVASLEHRPVLVLDGLDHLCPDAANRHFVASGLLADLSCSLVLTAPMSVCAAHSFDNMCTLESVPVLDHEAPPAPGAGVSFFREAWAKRAGALAGALTDAQVARLAWASGGLPRHFCRLARSVVERAEVEAVIRIEDAWIEEAIDEYRSELEDGMTRGDFALLQGVADDPRHELPGVPRARALLDEHRLVPYPNQSTWYFPHPLLTVNKVRAGQRSGLGS